jgi:hypothetical protein
MSFDDWFIAQFRDKLLEPLAETDGVTDVEIEAGLNGASLPQSVRAYWRVAGNHWLNTNHNQWLGLGEFQTNGEYTVFMIENQGVVAWAFRTDDLNAADPIVYQGPPDGASSEWHSEHLPFSQFIVAMWHWVLTGEEREIITPADLTHENGAWWYRNYQLTFCIVSEDLTYNLPLLQSLVARASLVVAAAHSHAIASVHASDIFDSSGVFPTSIDIQGPDTYCVWFRFSDSPHRYIGVKFVDETAVGVYCDHP